MATALAALWFCLPPPIALAVPFHAGELEALQECTIGLGAGDQKEMLTRMLSKIAALETAVAAAEARRRELHNQLVELKGNVSGPGLLRVSSWVCTASLCSQRKLARAL